MKLKLFAFAPAALALAFTGGANTAAPKEEPADVTDEVPYDKLSDTGKNVVKLTTALKLKELGWGKEMKGKCEGYSLESLLTAARMLRELPKPKEADPKAPDAKAFDPVAESNAILEHVKGILRDDFGKSPLKTAYQELHDAIEKIDNTKAVVGGPKIVTRVIKPGETHTLTFTALSAAPSALGVQANGTPLRFQLSRVDNNLVLFNQVATLSVYTWIPSGPAGKKNNFKVEVTNSKKVAVTYTVAVE